MPTVNLDALNGQLPMEGRRNDQRSDHDDQFLQDAELTRKIEKEKLNQIYKASKALQHNLNLYQGRCKICTLLPPCKHWDG